MTARGRTQFAPTMLIPLLPDKLEFGRQFDKLEFDEDIHRTKSYARHSEAAIAAVGIRYPKGYLRIATALRASQ